MSSSPAGYPPPLRLSSEALTAIGLVSIGVWLAPRRLRLISWMLGLIILLIVLLKLSALAMRLSLDRPLNLALDVVLLKAVADLTIGAFGTIAGALILLAGLGVIFLLWMALAASLYSVATVISTSLKSAAPIAASGLILSGVTLGTLIWPAWSWPTVSANTNRLVIEQVSLFARTERAKADFRIAVADDPLGQSDRTLPGLAKTDVVLAFIESYGRTALDSEPFAPLIQSRLAQVEADMQEAGLKVVSAWLSSPTIGGQSWLAHASVLGGIEVNNNAEYQALLQSDRLTLIDLFERTGHRSIAVMPAIIWPWPDGDLFGYDGVYAAADLGYQATPFNWVTMPDQFTLSAFERLERSVPMAERQPLFAEIALISSHAPWTPIAQLVDWSNIDEGGMIFDEMARQGPSPAEVWSDRERIRDHYARALDYTLSVVGDYATNFVDQQTLLIVLGDHQPAPIVTGEGAGPEVPIHVIASSDGFLRPFRSAGYTDGLVPGSQAPRAPMSTLRDLIAEGFNALDG
ncbi:MAG: sulfatase [Pseudomonadota bacterium]